jgi:hypothetical protein
VYLENGQTKAFKFEPNTTVKVTNIIHILHYRITSIILMILLI